MTDYSRAMLRRFAILEHPDLVHAITTRHGGVSRPPHATLNLSFSRPDDPAAVRENRRRVYAALEIPAARVVAAGQVHGSDVLVVREQHAGLGALAPSPIRPPADALITDRPNLFLLACFADCTPLLFWDPVRRAVGVAHAGWQGTLKGIAAATVAALHTAFGSDPADLRVLIGPSAGPCCYNVWPHVAAAVRQALPQDDVLHRVGDQTHFDLWAANRAILRRSGVPDAQIETSAICTICQVADFFSHRAEQGATGRFASIIGLRG